MHVPSQQCRQCPQSTTPQDEERIETENSSLPQSPLSTSWACPCHQTKHNVDACWKVFQGHAHVAWGRRIENRWIGGGWSREERGERRSSTTTTHPPTTTHPTHLLPFSPKGSKAAPLPPCQKARFACPGTSQECGGVCVAGAWVKGGKSQGGCSVGK